MKPLGNWEKFVFLPETVALPPRLQSDLTEWEPGAYDDLTPVSEDSFRDVMCGLLGKALAFDEQYRNPYHNYVTHFSGMVDRTIILVQDGKYPKAVQQAMILAALGHDLGHPGSSLRKDARKPLYMPELGVSVSNEWVSGYITDECSAEHGVSVGARLCTFSAIIATTFGDPNFKLPDHPLAHLIANADIAPSCELLEWVEQGICVLKEMPVQDRPATFREWVEGRMKFLTFVKSRMTPDGWALWGRNFACIEAGMRSLAERRDLYLSEVIERRISSVLAVD